MPLGENHGFVEVEVKRNHARFTITVDYWVAMLSKRFPGKIALKHRYIDDPINHGEGETWLSGKAIFTIMVCYGIVHIITTALH